MEKINIEQFLELMKHYPAFDVRTPSEYNQGRIPGAINLPLFTNEERAIVGTLYKKSGRNKAIFAGLEFVGPKMKLLAETMCKKAKDNTVLVHCWRGGMRSGSVAWLAELCGLKVMTLEKGYKAYRTWALAEFSRKRKIAILSGKTGSGKTAMLSSIKQLGEQVVDLEAIACHKGSAFGSLGEKEQPSQEQFENELAMLLNQTGCAKRLWLEDESRQIGKRTLPADLWNQMREAQVIMADVSLSRRADYLNETYGKFNPQDLIQSVDKIRDRFGPNRTRECAEAINSGNIKLAIEISLDYYDRTYLNGFLKRDPSTVHSIIIPDTQSFNEAAKAIVEYADEIRI